MLHAAEAGQAERGRVVASRPVSAPAGMSELRNVDMASVVLLVSLETGLKKVASKTPLYYMYTYIYIYIHIYIYIYIYIWYQTGSPPPVVVVLWLGCGGLGLA